MQFEATLDRVEIDPLSGFTWRGHIEEIDTGIQGKGKAGTNRQYSAKSLTLTRRFFTEIRTCQVSCEE